MIRLAVFLLLISITGCSAGQLERDLGAEPLTRETANSYSTTGGAQGRRYNRHDMNVLNLADYGRVLDSSRVKIDGTTAAGGQLGAIAGAANARDHTSSAESAIIRMVAGAVIGATIESSLTSGEAVEYILERRDGQLVSLVTNYYLPLGACVLLRSHPETLQTSAEVRPENVCERFFGDRGQ